MLGELELAWRLLPNEFIAVTGTNGKTTTTEWIGHVHREAALPVAVAGNVGTALSLAGRHASTRATIVCEASSFQLEDTIAFAPEAAVLLNLSPDHLDRHGTFEDYVAAKLKDLRQPGQRRHRGRPADLGVEDLGGCARRVRSVGARAPSCRSGPATCGGTSEPLHRVDEIALPGAHNRAQRDGRRRGRAWRAGSTPRRWPPACALRRRRAPARADRHP